MSVLFTKTLATSVLVTFFLGNILIPSGILYASDDIITDTQNPSFIAPVETSGTNNQVNTSPETQNTPETQGSAVTPEISHNDTNTQIPQDIEQKPKNNTGSLNESVQERESGVNTGALLKNDTLSGSTLDTLSEETPTDDTLTLSGGDADGGRGETSNATGSLEMATGSIQIDTDSLNVTGDAFSGGDMNTGMLLERDTGSSILSGSILDTHLIDETLSLTGGELIIGKGHRTTETIDGITVVATFTQDTTVQATNETPINEEMISVAEANSEEITEKTMKTRERTREANETEDNNEGGQKFSFDFGVKDTHLEFSHPVEIVLDAPDGLTDGDTVNLSVIHADSEGPTTDSLTLDPNALCQNGTVQNPTSSTVVKDGKVIFYTCGASTFILNATGNTSGITLWLKADTGFSGNNWNDQSGKGNNFTSFCTSGLCLSDTVQSVSSAINFRPAIRFSGSNKWLRRNTATNLNARTVFLVYSQSDNNEWTTPFTSANNTSTSPTFPDGLFHGNSDNTQIYNSTWTAPIALNGNNFINGNSVNFLTTSRPQIPQVQTRILTANANASVAYYVGGDRELAGRMMNGDIAEIIVYNAVLSQSKQETVESYLALKYGTTLNHNYTLSGGQIAWNMSRNNAFNTSIAGIGRDDGTTLNTTVSQSVNGTENVKMEVASSLANNQTLVSGHNNAQISTWTTSPADSAYLKETDRIWFFQENNGDTGNVTLSFPTSGLPSYTPTSTETVMLLQSSDPTFASGLTAIPLSLVSGSYTATLNIPDGSYYKIAIKTVPTLTNSALWLRADMGYTLDGSNRVTQWINQNNGVAYNNPNISRSFTWNSSGMNFNPVLSASMVEDSSNPLLLASTTPSTTNIWTVYSVERASLAGATSEIVGNTSIALRNEQYNNSGKFGVTRYGTSDYVSTLSPTQSPELVSFSHAKSKNYITITNTQGGTTSAQNLAVGTRTMKLSALRVGNGYYGDLAEVIMISGTVTSTQNQMIRSYLAIKYGMTLPSSGTYLQNYILSNNSVVWSMSSGAGYTNNITGIARDDGMGLLQKKSQSITDTGDIIVSVPSLANNSALMWGNNNASYTAWSTSNIPSGHHRIARTWFFQEKNSDTGNVTISYPRTSVPSGIVGALKLYISPTTSFSSPADIITGTENLTTNTWDFTVNIADGNYVTFGYGNMDTTPPNITSFSISSGTLLPTGNFPIQITYTDSGSAIDTASFSGTVSRWNSATSTYNFYSGTTVSGVNQSGGTVQIGTLPFGKYQLQVSVADTPDNIATKSIVFYVDQLDMNISVQSHDIGDISPNIRKNAGTSITVTVKTVGTPFRVRMLQSSMNGSGTNIPYWNGSKGIGFEKGPYLGNLTATNNTTGVEVINQTGTINTDGQQNTYTYTIRYSAEVDEEQIAGAYQALLSFQIFGDYPNP